jgi:hypothetical protein
LALNPEASADAADEKPNMNPYQKGASLLLRLVAAGLIVIGGLLVGLEFLNHRARGIDVNPLHVTCYALMFVAGAVLFALSSKLAARLTGGFDE